MFQFRKIKSDVSGFFFWQFIVGVDVALCLIKSFLSTLLELSSTSAATILSPSATVVLKFERKELRGNILDKGDQQDESKSTWSESAEKSG